MSSKSNAFALLYGFITLAIVTLFGTGQLTDWLSTAKISILLTELAAVFALIATGLVAALFGGNRKAIIVLGTLGLFFVLTLHQDIAMLRYMILSAVLFVIGVYGLVASRNAVRMLISIELMINAANINFVALSRAVDPSDIKGQVFAIFVLTVAAAEAAVGLALVLAIYRNLATVDMGKFNLLKW